MDDDVWTSNEGSQSRAGVHSTKCQSLSMLGFVSLAIHLSTCLTSCFGWFGAAFIGAYVAYEVRRLRESGAKLTDAENVHLDWAWRSGLLSAVWGLFLLLVYGALFGFFVLIALAEA
jgi:hypothetical protein